MKTSNEFKNQENILLNNDIQSRTKIMIIFLENRMLSFK